MTQDKLKNRSKKSLSKMARQRGISGWEAMSKDNLIRALGRRSRTVAASRRIKVAKAGRAKKASKAPVNGSHHRLKSRPIRPQALRGVARNTNGTTSAEEQVERSKFDVGVPTK